MSVFQCSVPLTFRQEYLHFHVLLQMNVTCLACGMTAVLLTQQRLNECVTSAAPHAVGPKHAPINAAVIIPHPCGSHQRNEVVPLKININRELYDTRL